METGFTVHLANPAAMPQHSGLKHTDDKTDARWLAMSYVWGYCQKAISARRKNAQFGIFYANEVSL
jgi:hypothetical protein